MAGNRRNTRNNRSFPAPLNAPVWLYQPCARSFSFNQKRGRGEVRKNRGPVVPVAELWILTEKSAEVCSNPPP